MNAPGSSSAVSFAAAPASRSPSDRSVWRALGRLAFLIGTTSARIVQALREASRGVQREAEIAHAWGLTLLRGLGVRVDVTGAIPAGEPVLLVANHRSYIDAAVLLGILPCALVAKSELASWPLLGTAARVGGTLFVRRADRGSRRATRDAILARVAAGVPVVVFPEGTTCAGPDVLPFRPGIFEAAAAAGIPVVPVALTYADRGAAWVGDDTFVPHFLRVFARRGLSARVAFGPRLTGDDPAALRDAAWRFVSATTAELDRA